MKKFISLILICSIFIIQLPAAVFADGYLGEPSVQNAAGVLLPPKGNGTVTMSGRSIQLVFESGAVIDKTTLEGITLDCIDTRNVSIPVTITPSVMTNKNKVRIAFSQLETDVTYRLTVPKTVGTAEKTLQNDFSFDFSVIDSGFVKGIALGEEYTSVTADDIIATKGDVRINGDNIEINGGGSVTFGFYAKYALRGVTMMYQSGSGDLSVKMGEREYILEDLDASIDNGEYTLLFYKYSDKEKQLYRYERNSDSGYVREFAEHRGEWEVTVSATDSVCFSEIRFLRELTTKPGGTRWFSLTEPGVTEEVAATYSTIAIDEKSPVMFVNGGRRYIDYNNLETKPYEYKSRLYLPINTLAKALGYYHEEDADKGYALMRNDTHDVVMLGGRSYIVEGVADKKPLAEEVLIYRNGQTYGAVRYFAELMGDTVGYDDGLVVIDNKYTVEEAMSPGSLKEYIKSTLAPFKAEAVKGKTYYVDQNSKESKEDGTAEKPFKTIKEAADIAKAGDTVMVKDGIYRETLTPKYSGTARAPINFIADGDNVVISAADKVSGWTLHQGNIYKASMNWDLGTTRNQVFINNEMLNEARYPNGPEVLFDTEKLDNAWAVRGDLWRPGDVLDENKKVIVDNSSIVRSSTLLWQKEPDYWKGGYFVGHFGLDYSVMTANIIGSKEGELTLGDEKSTMWYTNESYFNFGYIVGHMNCLDAPGEWIHQDNTLYMIFPEDATPNQTVVEAKARQLVIDLNGKSYINIKGFKTIGGGARTDGDMNVMNGLDMKYISHFIHQSHPYKGEVDFPFDAKNENGNVERGESGIYLRGSDDCVINCNIDHTAGAGIFLSGLYSYVENNIITDSYNSNYVSGIQMMNRGYEEKNRPRGGHFIYNNTVCRTGRSCLNISTQAGTEHSPYLPCDIAYNDFHDAMMTTLDTGATYDYGVQLGVDGYNTKLHHNYVYMTIGGRDTNPHDYGIYHDGDSHGTDTYNNQIFYTEVDSPFVLDIHEQTATIAPAYHRVWDNTSSYIKDGKAALDEKYFSEGKMYYAGANREPDTNAPVSYTKNYDKFIADDFQMDNVVSPENISDGVIYDEKSGYAAFSGVEQTITFTGVNFPENSNIIAFTVKGDSYETEDIIEVTIGEDVYEAEIFVNSYDVDDPVRVTIPIDKTSGVHDVVVTSKKFKSLQIGGMYAYADYMGEVLDEKSQYYSAYRWAGEFDSTSVKKPQVLYLSEYPGKKLMNSTYGDCWVKYDDVVFSEDSDKFVMSAGSGGDYANQQIELYVMESDSTGISGEPAASFIEDSDIWADRDPQLIALEETISAGTYDVYIKFLDSSKTCTVIYFGFIGTGEIPPEISKDFTRVYGEKFDIESSTSNPEFPLKTTYMNPPNYKRQGITYTLPGACAVFKDVSIPVTTSSFIINYACEDGLDGQPVEVWLGDPESGGEKIAEFVTESTGGYMNFVERKITCSKTIPIGIYDVYLKFCGDLNARKTIHMEWFSFLN